MNTIKQVRNNKNWTQQKLSDESGVPLSSIKQYESGKRNPKYEQLQKIADALNVSVTTLLNDSYKTILQMIIDILLEKYQSYEEIERITGIKSNLIQDLYTNTNKAITSDDFKQLASAANFDDEQIQIFMNDYSSISYSRGNRSRAVLTFDLDISNQYRYFVDFFKSKFYRKDINNTDLLYFYSLTCDTLRKEISKRYGQNTELNEELKQLSQQSNIEI